MEHRIARAGGHRSDDEARALNARIADLGQLLETVSSEHNMLTTQVSACGTCDGKQKGQLGCCGGAVLAYAEARPAVCSVRHRHLH